MRYHSLGEVPPKRHAQTRRDGKLLVEEVMGYEGFSGNESILYHLNSPCRIDEAGEFTPLVRESWVPDVHVYPRDSCLIERRDERAPGSLPEAVSRGGGPAVHVRGCGWDGSGLRVRNAHRGIGRRYPP